MAEKMTDEQFVRELGSLYEKVMELRKNEDYVVNQAQMDKFVEVLTFFTKATKKGHGKVESIDLKPKEEHGGLTATFVVFDVYGEEEVQKFSKVISYASAVTIDGTSDGICISLTIPNVFVKHN